MFLHGALLLLILVLQVASGMPAWAIFFGFCASFLSFTAVSLMLLFGALLVDHYLLLRP
jgi:hypothetical protein